MLFEKFAPRIMTVCRRYAANHQEAEDIMQETFIRVFSKLHQFKFEGSFEGWVTRIAAHCAIRYVKQAMFEYQEILPDESHVNSEALGNLNEEELLGLIQEMPAGYRIIFNLYAIDGYSHDEIAKLLNIEPVTSRTQLMKARKLLQRKIQSLVNSEKI